MEVIPPPAPRRYWSALGRAGVGLAIVSTGAFIAYTSMRANAWFGHSLTPDPVAGEVYSQLSVAAEVLACRSFHQLRSRTHMAEIEPRELFERIARALCPGNAWPSAIADLMGVRLDTIRHWRSGRSHLRVDHFATMLSLVADKQVELKNIEADLRQWLSKQPRED